MDPVPFRPHVTLLKTSKLPPGAQKRFRHGIEKKLYTRHKVCSLCVSAVALSLSESAHHWMHWN